MVVHVTILPLTRIASVIRKTKHAAIIKVSKKTDNTDNITQRALEIIFKLSASKFAAFGKFSYDCELRGTVQNYPTTNSFSEDSSWARNSITGEGAKESESEREREGGRNKRGKRERDR